MSNKYRVIGNTFISSEMTTAIPREFTSPDKALAFANKSYGAIEVYRDGVWKTITRQELKKAVGARASLRDTEGH
jgi:hypothetical protein